MQLRKLLLPGLLSVTLLSGCSLFSGEEDVVKMSHCRRLKTSLPHPPRGMSPWAMGLVISIPTFILRMQTALSMPLTAKVP